MKEQQLRSDVLELLEGKSAHGDLHTLTDGLPGEMRGAVPEGQSHSPWRLVEHLRIAIEDIVDFVLDPDAESPDWPEGFWPDGPAPPSDAAWESCIAAIEAKLDQLRSLVRDDGTDLTTAPPHTGGKTLLRACLLAADHNAYHLGQLATVRKLLGVPAEAP